MLGGGSVFLNSRPKPVEGAGQEMITLVQERVTDSDTEVVKVRRQPLAITPESDP